MNPTREALSAFVDGELDAVETARIAALVERDADLKAYVEDQERLRDGLRAAFADIVAAPVPARLLATAERAPISFRVRLTQWLDDFRDRAGSPVIRFAVPALTMALGLVIGVGVERNATTSADLALSPSTGQIVARADLAAALESKLASDTESGPARIGLTFRDKDGAACRSFEVSGGGSVSEGFACRHNGTWQVGALISGHGPAAGGGEYSLAGSAMPDAVRDAITTRMSGAPLDAAAERQARDRGWN
jgi:hypothetical protein